MSYDAPTRVWVQGQNGKWYSRDWLPGELAEYRRNVLARK
jgi:hypothetical protein